jgi:hypothetical protein
MRVFAGRTLLLLISAVFAVNADDVIYPDGDRSQEYLDKWKDKHPQEIHNELDRLMSLMESNMEHEPEHELKDWVKERRSNLQQIVDQSDEIKAEL